MCARPKRAPFACSTTSQVLTYLSEASGEYISGELISQNLALSRVAIWKHVRTLRTQGCRIDACRHRGYRLLGVPDLPTEHAVAGRLQTSKLGRPLVFYRNVPSTNHLLSTHAVAGAAEGMALVADQQTVGRGRMGRAWFSPPGVNLYFSILLRPQAELAQSGTLPLVVGCAVARTIAEMAPGVPLKIKWPNDLLVQGRKLGGILCEMSAETASAWHVVVGVGLNVNMRRKQLPRMMAGSATSLCIETGRTHARAEILATLLNRMEHAYTTWEKEGLIPFLPEIQACDMLKGQSIRLEQAGKSFEGIADGIQADGTLLLRMEDGSHRSIHSGDAHLIPSQACG